MENALHISSPTVRSVGLTVLAFMIATFAVQAGSHFGLNAEHYAGIPIMREAPVMPLGVAAMVIQGLIAGTLFPRVRWADGSVRSGIGFAWLMGAFLGSYIALAEPAKYAVPSIAAWMAVEASASFVQFTLFGVLLGWIHRDRQPGSA